MASRSNPYRSLQISSCCTSLFGFLSVIVGIAEMCVWLALMGVYGSIGPDNGEVLVMDTFGGVSGAGLAFITGCGLWCGIWIAFTGICGCCVRSGRQADKNDRTRIVVCIASAMNAAVLCPVQIALYAWIFTPEVEWARRLYLAEPVWWAVTLQSVGIGAGVLSFILCIINVVMALRIKPYAGQNKTWEDFDI